MNLSQKYNGLAELSPTYNALRELSQLDVGRVQFNAPMAEHTWWHIGGAADLLVEPCRIDQVQTLMKALRYLKLPSIVIGRGSNLLFDDRGVRCVVVKIGRTLSRISIQGEFVISEAGAFVPCLVRNIAHSGLSGLEHAVGIPGTIGGLVLMNGGSMRKSVGNNVEKVWAVNSTGDILEYDHAGCRFAYRHSALQEQAVILVKVGLRLAGGTPRDIRRKMLEILAVRRDKFPLKHPNCGSVFLSDPEMYAAVGPPGKVIEDCGLKGLRLGDAMISHKHANFIVNLGQARSSDVLDIILRICQCVSERTGFRLLCEVRYISPSGRTIAAHQATEEQRI